MKSNEKTIEEVWRSLFVPDDLIQALVKAQFIQPTPIQSHVLPAAIRDHSDILGSAPTGSGKTLSFGIPLLVRVKEIRSSEMSEVPGAADSNLDNESYLDMKATPMEVDQVMENTTVIKTGRKKRKALSIGKPFSTSFNEANYLNLAMIEELDAETGKVTAVHSLADRSLIDSDVAPSPNPEPKLMNPRPGRVIALVLLPTRELALQVCQHLRIISEFVKPRIRIEAIVGGISMQKQTRLLSYKPEVIVATPGRLWQFIQQEDPHLCTVRDANFLVVDEADKLVEANHFEDLRELFTWLRGENSDRIMGSGSNKHVKRRQTMVFSATLTFVHRGALKPGTGAKHRKHHFSDRNRLTTELKLSALRDLFGLSPRAKVFDLSSTSTTGLDSVTEQATSQEHNAMTVACPEGLQEYRFLCASQPSKDLRLFWFLAFGRHFPIASPAPTNQRCLIFLNSKSGVRRLAGVMRQLTQGNAFAVSEHPIPQYVNALHADMVQKQRLRALERFQADPNGILLASDVASRGLDLASMGNLDSGGVAWVVHFDVPHTAELYIHRRGRTARAYRTGTSVLFVCPAEIPLWRRLALSLKRTDTDLADFPLEPSHFQLTACERIVDLAKQLDLIEHTAARKKANDNWFARAAKSADILLESDDTDDSEGAPMSKRQKVEEINIKFHANAIRSEMQQFVAASRKSLAKKSHVQPGHIESTARLLKNQLNRVRKTKRSRNRSTKELI